MIRLFASMHSSENRKLLNPEVRLDGTDGVSNISEGTSLRRSGQSEIIKLIIEHLGAYSA